LTFEYISSIGVSSGLYGGSGRTRAPALSMASSTAADRWTERLSKTTTSPSCNAGTNTPSTYVWKVAALVDPGNTSGARTPSSPSAAVSVTDSHEPGAEASARSPRGAQA
jgi:hypothetical protein